MTFCDKSTATFTVLEFDFKGILFQIFEHFHDCKLWASLDYHQHGQFCLCHMFAPKTSKHKKTTAGCANLDCLMSETHDSSEEKKKEKFLWIKDPKCGKRGRLLMVVVILDAFF